jgi:hypothetical protein
MQVWLQITGVEIHWPSTQASFIQGIELLQVKVLLLFQIQPSGFTQTPVWHTLGGHSTAPS